MFNKNELNLALQVLSPKTSPTQPKHQQFGKSPQTAKQKIYYPNFPHYSIFVTTPHGINYPKKEVTECVQK
jgi:hypothetical protein